jgi:hypothetical protein
MGHSCATITQESSSVLPAGLVLPKGQGWHSSFVPPSEYVLTGHSLQTPPSDTP